MSAPIPVLAILHFNRPDLTARALAAIDFPVEKLVIVQQGPDNEFDHEQILLTIGMINVKYQKKLIKEFILIRHPNAGCAGGWNEVIKLFPAAWWMFLANDIEPAAGDLERMATAAWSGCAEYAAFFGNHGHGLFINTRRGIERVGLYDENIYPAYLEDCDWMRRRHLLGEKYQDVPNVSAIHGDGKLTGSCTINSNAALAAANSRTHGANFRYYKTKWGGLNEHEVFKTPFNDLHWPLWAWKFDPQIRADNQW